MWRSKHTEAQTIASHLQPSHRADDSPSVSRDPSITIGYFASQIRLRALYELQSPPSNPLSWLEDVEYNNIAGCEATTEQYGLDTHVLARIRLDAMVQLQPKTWFAEPVIGIYV